MGGEIELGGFFLDQPFGFHFLEELENITFAVICLDLEYFHNGVADFADGHGLLSQSPYEGSDGIQSIVTAADGVENCNPILGYYGFKIEDGFLHVV
jgi:hypothetical protein